METFTSIKDRNDAGMDKAEEPDQDETDGDKDPTELKGQLEKTNNDSQR